MSDERSQPASPRARERALAQGRGPATPEIAGVLIALAIAALSRQLPFTLHEAFARLAQALWSPGTFRALGRATLEPGALRPPDLVPPGFAILAMVPVAVALAFLVQKGFRFMPGRVGPDAARLMPRAPWGDGTDALELLARGAARTFLGFYLGWRLLGAADAPLRVAGSTVPRIAAAFTHVAILWLLLAAVDWFWRRYRFEQSIMMTPAEVRAENRSTDGDPRVKAEIHARAEANRGHGPAKRVLLREGDVVALVTIHEDSTRTPVVQVGARGAQADRLLAGSQTLAVPVLAMRGARKLAGARPGSPVPEELFDELAALHRNLFPRKAGDTV